MFQFRPPLQLQQKWGNCTASKSWHGASEEIKCHWHLLRLSVATAQVATLNLPRRRKAEPQEPVGKAFYQHERFCMLKSVDVKIIGWSTDGKCHMDSAHVASATKLSSNISYWMLKYFTPIYKLTESPAFPKTPIEFLYISTNMYFALRAVLQRKTNHHTALQGERHQRQKGLPTQVRLCETAGSSHKTSPRGNLP